VGVKRERRPKPPAGIDHFRKLIAKVAPELDTSGLTQIGEGMDSSAYRADGFVFRFPKVSDTSRKYAVEAALLPKLVGEAPLAVPDIRYVGKDRRTGHRFLGYRLLEGTPLTELAGRSLSEGMIQAVAEELGPFLAFMRRFPLEVAVEAGVDDTPFRVDYQRDWQRVQDEVYPLLDKSLRKRVAELYEDYLGDDRNFEHSPALLHGDLWPEHILCDPTSGRPRAIIDFGDLRVGDPDFDLMPLYGMYGRDVVAATVTARGGAPTPELFRKLGFYLRANTLKDVLAGLDREDDDLTAWALEIIKQDVTAAD
jgi:aminoglycoside 2''-phosphotransferase